jgi:hypothetical protein
LSSGRGADSREALRLTGFFLEHRACPALGSDALPEARARLTRLLENHEMVAPGKPRRRSVRR